MWMHDIDDKVLIIGADDRAVQTLQAQLELSGLRGRLAVVDDQPVPDGRDLSPPSLVIWDESATGGGAGQLVEAMIAKGVPVIVIGADGRSGLLETDAVLHGNYTVPKLLETVGRFVDLPRPADVISMDRPRGSLVDEEAFFHDLFDRASDGILLIDYDTHLIIEVNDRAEALYGYDRRELIGMSLLEIVPQEEHVEMWINSKNLDADEELVLHAGERTHLTKDGRRLTVSVSASLLTCRGRKIFQDIVRDETERFEREHLLEQILDSAPDPTVIVDADGNIQFVNRQLQAAFGYTRDELINQPVEVLVPERLAKGHVSHRDNYNNNPQPREMGSGMELCGQTKDGCEIPIEVSLAPVKDHGKRLVAASIRDITERKRSRDALRESEARFRDFADSAGDWFWETDDDLRFTFLSERFEEVMGWPSDQVLGMTRRDLYLAANAEDQRWQAHAETLDSRHSFYGFEYDSIRSDGERRIMSVSGKPVFDVAGAFRGYRGVARDVTQERELDRALRESEGRLKALFDHAPTEIHFKDCEGRYVLLNRHVEQLLGVPAADAIGKTPHDILSNDMADHFAAHDRRVMETGETNEQRDHWHTTEGDRTYLTIKFPVRDEDGSITGIGAMGIDITVLERAEEQLRKSHRELEERVQERTRELERQQEVLRQAQKMEAIGQLTGGVAHDFNNLLTAILGNLEMLEMWHGDDERSGKAISQAQEAADLGAELTGRLLAFARRQPLDPKAISLSDVVLDMSDLLSRTLGETIEVNTVLANPLNNAFVDPVQVQNALLNLCLNARDAMSDGGRLTIETSNVTLDEDYAREHPDVNAGDYVMLSVTDTGTGMAPEIREHVFEPFFTTKSVGKGSGLGLSMIYGFVKQSEGHIRLYSEVGHGTAISLYFPQAQDTSEVAEMHDAEEAMPRARGEVVLVVEDEPRVRHVTVQRLEALGYTVLEAENGPAALDVLATSLGVDLVFTDVVMPGGMSGRDLAAKVRDHHPEMKIMLTSGYAEQAGIENDALDEGEVWLRKPYRLVELARMIREVLDG